MTEWVDDDEVTITYRTLRQGIAEAVEGERNRIVQVLLAECDCEEMYRCTYHRMVDAIRVDVS
jgi:hypothetical protein